MVLADQVDQGIRQDRATKVVLVDTFVCVYDFVETRRNARNRVVLNGGVVI